ncbi:putative uncharacterized protein DDB_G0282133 isoform X2 [Condylostylus longicornis]|uniref:putative uncharacterized protein DDB_G0282133 isoform X2 n=1 Tax=Condylostylus longicornis TaxID=2530218 RepID=UPI00244E02FD|nr:putative uncharacterized protein DDB_G0282133 isoform X2 [Condylostylus longicornis]
MTLFLNSFKTYLTNRKGQKRHHHYYPPTDANTLKKLTAIQCLTEAVSSEQEISNIETLVDELCDKLNDIEKQLDSDENEYQTIGQILNFITVVGSATETSDIGASTSVSLSSSSSSSSKATEADSSSFVTSSTEEYSKSYSIRNKNSINLNIFTKQRNNKSNKARVIIDLKDIEDPRKRYYNAFPALTKEMEDSFRNSNRYTKALTWPNDKTTSFIQQRINNTNINNNLNNNNTNNNNNINNNNNNHNNNNNSNNNNNNNNNSNNNNYNNSHNSSKTNNNNIHSINYSNNNSNKHSFNTDSNYFNSTNINNQNEMYNKNNHNLSNINTAGVKRKPKRRRNQALSKGRTNNNHQRKSSYSGNCSPTWDTDFEGSWEMGRDLIKEFIVRENNRNRSTSESAAYNEDLSNISNKKRDGNVVNNTINEEIKSEKFQTVNDREENAENIFYGLTSINHLNKNSFLSNLLQNKENLATNLNGPKFQYSISSDIMQPEISSTTNANNTPFVNSNNLNVNMDQNNLLSDEGYSTHENLTSLSELDTSGMENIDTEKQFKIKNDPRLSSAQRRLYERDMIIDNNDDSSMSFCSNIEQQQYDFAQFKAKFNSSVEALWRNNADQNDNSNFSGTSEELRSLPSVQQNQGLNSFWTNYYNHRYDNNKFENINEENQSENIEQRDFLSMPNQNNVITVSKQTPSLFLQDSIWSDSSKNYDDDESFYAGVKKSMQYKNFKEKSICENYPHDITKCQEGINEITFEEQPTNSVDHQNSISNLNYGAREMVLHNLYNIAPNNLQQNDATNYVQPYISEAYNEEISSYNKHPQQTFQQISLKENESFINDQYRKYKDRFKSISPPITLENHAKSSAFIEYSRIKNQNIDNSPQSNYQEAHFDKNMLSKTYVPTYTEDENLLTSDRTHFRPIKQTYVDGYVFDICNYLDEIEYERSHSGFLCYDGEKFLEFNKFEGGAVLCEGDKHSLNEKVQGAQNSKYSSKNIVTKKYEEFVLKFRINNKNEKYCQTDPPPRSPHEMSLENITDLQNLRIKNFNENYYSHFISESESENASNYCCFEEENRSSTSTEDYEKFDNSFVYSSSNNNGTIESAKAAAAVIMAAVANNNNQFASSKKLPNWSMFDIRQKCSANMDLNKYKSIGNNNDNHTLWGSCAACNFNQELESFPANRLLKDELKIEGDEIMSDLKYMQDLFIGSDWEEGTCSSSGGDSDNLASDIVETDFEIVGSSDKNKKSKNKKLLFSNENNFLCNESVKSNNMENIPFKDEMQTDLYYNVTKLIADLLRPENAKSLANALGEAAIQAANVHAKINNKNNTHKEYKRNDTEIESFCGGLLTNDEQIIWKHNELKPLDKYLTRFNSSSNNNNNLLDANDSSGKLKWEHSNLADIWKQELKTSSKQNFPGKTEAQYKKENFEFEHLKHIRYGSDNNCKSSKTYFKNNENENLPKTYSNNMNQKVGTSNISENSNILKETNTENAESLKNESSTPFNINSNPYFGFTRKNNRIDRKRRHSASQMVTSSCNKEISSIIPNEGQNFSEIVISSTNNNNISSDVFSKGSSNINENPSNTTINNIIGNGKENLKFEISNNCRNFLHNYQNIIGGGDSKKEKKHFNFYENFILGGNKIELMGKDLLIKAKLNDYVVNMSDDNDETKVTSTTTSNDTTASSTSGATIISCNLWALNTKLDMAKDFDSNDSAFWQKNIGYLDYGYNNVDDISSISPSSILKHVALVSRPLTR